MSPGSVVKAPDVLSMAGGKGGRVNKQQQAHLQQQAAAKAAAAAAAAVQATPTNSVMVDIFGCRTIERLDLIQHGRLTQQKETKVLSLSLSASLSLFLCLSLSASVSLSLPLCLPCSLN